MVDTNVLKRGATEPTQRLISVYNFRAVSLFHENFSSRPDLCFLLSEHTKRYSVPVVPEAKTDAEFVHQLSTAEASLNLRMIMRSENVAQVVLYGSVASAKAIYTVT